MASSLYHAPENEIGPRPFLKWSGGKSQLLTQLLERVPTGFGTYREPFLGGGALFFALQPKKAVLSDSNERLVRTYTAVRDRVKDVIDFLRQYAEDHSESEYYRVRAGPLEGEKWSDAQVAAWLIYVNKTCFNGLYRVNKRGLFNNPIGKLSNRSQKRVICDANRLRDCSRALQGADIVHMDFRRALGWACFGDFLYCDPPYVPASATASFTSYTADGFGHQDQVALADLAAAARDRNVRVLLSNAGLPVVRQLYEARGFRCDEVYARRAINSVASKRGAVKEFLIS